MTHTNEIFQVLSEHEGLVCCAPSLADASEPDYAQRLSEYVRTRAWPFWILSTANEKLSRTQLEKVVKVVKESRNTEVVLLKRPKPILFFKYAAWLRAGGFEGLHGKNAEEVFHGFLQRLKTKRSCGWLLVEKSMEEMSSRLEPRDTRAQALSFSSVGTVLTFNAEEKVLVSQPASASIDDNRCVAELERAVKLLEGGSDKEALELLDKLLTLRQDQGVVFYAKAFAHFRLGEVDAGNQALSRLFTLEPMHEGGKRLKEQFLK